jgi:hypothetical protein
MSTHNITEILLQVGLNTITPLIYQELVFTILISFTECTLGVVTSPLQNDQLVCHVSNRCTDINCCLYDTETFRHYKLFLHIDPCDYRLQIGIELYSFDVSLLDFDFGKNNYSTVWCYHAPKGSAVNFTSHQNFIELI